MNDAEKTLTTLMRKLRAVDREAVRHRRAEVTNNSPVMIQLGGSSVSVPAEVLPGFAPAIGDTVSVLSFDNDLLVIGASGGGPTCKVHKSGTQSLSSGSATAITFDTEDYDPDGIHSTASNTSRITPSTAGVYKITAHAEIAAGSSAGARTAELRINGSTIIARNNQISLANGLLANSLEVTADHKFNGSTDYVELILTQGSGGALNCNSADLAVGRLGAG